MRKIIFVSTIAIATLVGCNSSTEQSKDHDESSHFHDESSSHDHGDGHDHDHEGQEHTYTCPMHPEIVSKGPGNCPKCAMKLEHTDKAPGDDKKYVMVFKVSPEPIKAGQKTLLSFRPTVEKQDKSLVPLDIVHEKKIHLLIFSKDLSFFAHEHPEYKSTGDYDWNFTFPNGGDFILFQDYTPKGSGHQLGRQDLKVEGKEKPAIPLGNQRLEWKKDSYQLSLSADKSFTVNTLIELKVHLTKDGKPLTTIKNYLGALAHMIVISEDTKEYLHVHPMDSKTQGPDVILHTNFPKAGKYKVFVQFDHDGLHTADFIVDVK